LRIHIAFNKVDAELELSPTHSPKRTYLRTKYNTPVTHQRFIEFSKSHRDELILQQDNLIETLSKKDDEIDINLLGKLVNNTSYITVNKDLEPVYNFTLIDKLQQPDGSIQERPHQRTLSTINSDIPVIITEKLYDPEELMLNYIFRKSYYITHYDGVTFKFLFDIAKWLSEEGKFAEVEAFNIETKKRDAIVLVDGGRKYPRGFLEGIVNNNRYCLILHLTDQELKLPETFPAQEVEEEEGD
jgi:hypothetical protein